MMRPGSSAIAFALFALAGVSQLAPSQSAARDRHLLYVAVPGVRNYVEHGGVGILVYDIDDRHRFLKRIPTFETHDGEAPETFPSGI